MHNMPLTANQIRNLNGGQQRNFAPNQQPPPNQQRNSRGMNRVSNRTCMYFSSGGKNVVDGIIVSSSGSSRT